MNVKRNRKPLPIFEKLEVIDTGTEGQSVAKNNDLVVFISNAIPGDVADVQITKKKNNYHEGIAINYHKLSEKRSTPACEHFGVCGGCKWQHMQYQWQLHYKQKQVFDAFTRIGKVEFPEISTIIPSKTTFYYRNKLEYTFSNKMWLTKEDMINDTKFDHRNALGFHIPKLFDKILDIKHCHLQKDPSNAIRLEIRKYGIENNLDFFDIKVQVGFLRNLIIRTSSTNELMVILSFFREEKEKREKLLDHLSNKFPEITALLYVINPKGNDSIADLEVMPYKGQDCIYEQMGNLKFKISPKSFFQTNSEQAFELYKTTFELAGLTGTELVYDLYTGTGTIANFVAHKAKKVVGIEYVEDAIKDAQINSQLNNINNTSFFAGDMSLVLNQEFIAKNGHPDVIITDPPRAGMHENVTNKLLEIEPQKIVYVSCNPSTQARDLVLLTTKYKIEKIQPVDMFPHTHHVENIVLLVKK